MTYEVDALYICKQLLHYLVNMDKTVVLYEGYSCNKPMDNEMIANCSCTLVQAQKNIIVDTMTPWDSEKIIHGLYKRGLNPEDIDYVVCTHGHSDHIGNNNLFLKAKHIVGYSVSFKETYYLHPFDKGVEYKLCDDVQVIPTPGHTNTDVTVIVAGDWDVVAITGDLFEKLQDIEDPNIWLDAGSENPQKQRYNRYKIAKLVDWIVPGHGPAFKVTESMINTLKKQLDEDIDTKV